MGKLKRQYVVGGLFIIMITSLGGFMAQDRKDMTLKIKYKLNTATQNIKLYFSQGKETCMVSWDDKKNSWTSLRSACERIEEDLSYADEGNISIYGTSRSARQILIESNWDKKDKREDIFITEFGWRTERQEKEWISRKKIYAHFKTDYLEFIKELYRIISDLACNPDYVGANNKFSKESKYQFLSVDLEKIVSGKEEWLVAHSKKVLSCLKKRASNGEDFYNRGFALYNLGKYKAALKDFNKALRKKKQLGEEVLTWCYRERGRTFRALKRYKQAEKDLLTALKRDPRYTLAYSSLAQLYSNTEQYDKALQIELKELKKNPHDKTLLYNIGISYKRKKQWKKALGFFMRAQQEDETEAAAFLQTGLCNHQLRHLKNAFEIYEQVLLKLNDKTISFAYSPDTGLLSNAADLCLTAKNYDLAKRLALAGKNSGVVPKQYRRLLAIIEKKLKN